MGNNTLYWPTDGDDPNAKMLGFRAWFRINGSSVSGAPIRRGMPAALHIVSTTTDINPVTHNPSPITDKILRDGRLIILRNGVEYTVSGQRINEQ